MLIFFFKFDPLFNDTKIRNSNIEIRNKLNNENVKV